MPGPKPNGLEGQSKPKGVKDMTPEELKERNRILEEKYNKNLDALRAKDRAKELARGEDLENLINKIDAQDYLILDVLGTKISIVRCLTKKQQLKQLEIAEKLTKRPEKVTKKIYLEILSDIYNFMADICVAPPWNISESWSLIDETSGSALTIFKGAMSLIGEEDKAIAGFRTTGRPKTT